MNNKVENLNPDDVVCFTDDDGYNTPIYNIKQRFSIGRLFEFGEFVDAALVPPNEEQKVLFSKECRNLLSKLVNAVFEQKVPVHPVFVLGYWHSRFF